jgi:hypothetical protein
MSTKRTQTTIGNNKSNNNIMHHINNKNSKKGLSFLVCSSKPKS